VVELLGASPDRVVIGGGVDERFGPDREAAGRAARALGLERPYVLTVGSLIARKNLGALARAAGALAGRGMDLVAAGGGRPQLRAEQGRDGIRTLGHVDDAQLPGLYAGARAFVLASRHEGFGLTCVEAMASEVPVVVRGRMRRLPSSPVSGGTATASPRGASAVAMPRGQSNSGELHFGGCPASIVESQ